MATQLHTDPPAARAIALPADTARTQVQLARKQALRGIALGTVAFLVGLAITLVTYSDASSSPAGGTYVVAWGPMLFGIVACIRGLVVLGRTAKLK